MVAGTSAGASLLSEHMIALGDSGSTPRRRLVHMAKGLGLAPNLIIDQHFRRRDRLGRLLTALSYNPEPIGIGRRRGHRRHHRGRRHAERPRRRRRHLVDASGLRYTDSYAVQRGQPLAMMGLKLDFLTSGCRYDLRRRVGIPPRSTSRLGSLMEPAAVEAEVPDPTPVGLRDGE